MIPYLWVAAGSAFGGVFRFALGRLTADWNTAMPWTTILINVLGSFVIGFFGTLTLSGGRFAVPENLRIFVMIGICGGFTTFSSFSLESFELLRSGHWARAAMNIGVSVLLCIAAVALGSYAGRHGGGSVAVAETIEEQVAG